MKIEVVETRRAVIDVDMSAYEEGATTEDILAIEKNNSTECYDYMDIIDADSVMTFKVIEE